MAKKQTEHADDQLFQTLQKNKKRRVRRIWLTAIGITLGILLALGITVRYLRGRVDQKFHANDNEVLAYTAATGSISTTVSGTGILEDMDLEELSVPSGVTIDEIQVSQNDTVVSGDIIATVDMSSVLSAMSQVQTELDAFDEQLSEAEDDAVESAVKAGVSGRVMQIFCEEGDTVSDCMYKNGALMLLSTDGFLAGTMDAPSLSAGDSVKGRIGDDEFSGLIDTVDEDGAVVLFDDADFDDGAVVTVYDEDGARLGVVTLSVHNPLHVTGFAGSIRSVNVSVGDRVNASTEVITLTDTEYSANYEAILRQRGDKEEELLQLLQIYHDGALLAPISGTVSSVTEQEEPNLYYETPADQIVASISPDRQMSVTISVDESDILSLSEGQSVELTVGSIGDDPFEGVVSEINKTALSAAGVTSYSAKIVLDKQPRMLAGMSAKAVIRIQGVDSAIIIPADAVHQTSASAFVYTGYDPQTGEYSGKVEVTTGLSNSNEVEITSGLHEGDVVYYTERRSGNIWGFGGFGGRPSGGWEAPEDFGNFSPSGGSASFSGWSGGQSGGSRPSFPGSSARPAG